MKNRASILGLLVIASAFFSHSLSFFGVEGWSLLDFILPVVFGLYVIILIVNKKLSYSLSYLSLIPLAMLFIVTIHILTDPRLNEIVQALEGTSIPTGGLRIYFSIFISILLYYTVPMVIREKEHINKFIKIYLGLVLFQIIFSYFRMAMGIHYLPWDSYGSQILAFDPHSYWGSGTRLILLGDMGIHLFVFALILMEAGRWRNLLIGLSVLSIYVSKGRAPIFSIILVLLIYLIIKKKHLFLTIGISTAVIAILIFFRFHPSTLNKLPAGPKRILSVLSTENPTYLTGTFSRMEMWEIQGYIIKNNPLWGSVNDFPYYSDPRAKKAVQIGDTHSVYLGLAAVFGIPMLLFWLIFVAGRVKRLCLIWTQSNEDSQFHRVALWLFLILVAYLFNYLTGGGAAGGYHDAYVFFALVDVTFKHYIKTKAGVV